MSINLNQRKSRTFTAIVSILVGLTLIGVAIYYFFLTDYARTAVTPIEKALFANGITKKCSTGSAGHGPDTRQPWYKAIYEIPGERDAATKLLMKAVIESGYNLTEHRPDINVEDNSFYRDGSKRSTFWGLKDGYVDVNVVVYGSKSYDETSDFCTVHEGAATGTTTFSLTLSLPEYR